MKRWQDHGRAGWLARTVVVSVAAVALAACSGANPSATSKLPDNLEDVLASAHRTMTIKTAAENVMIRDCMENLGFEFYMDDLAQIDSMTNREQLEFFVGKVTEESAPDTGYGPYVDSPYFDQSSSDDDADFATTSQARNAEYYDSLSKSEQDAYGVAFNGGPDGRFMSLDDGTGIPADGCLGRAGQELLGDQLADVTLAFNKIQNIVSQLNVVDDVVLVETSKRWSNCMAKSGYDFESVHDAIAAGVALRGDSVAPQDDEIAQAVADAACQAQTDLANEVLNAYTRKQAELIQGHLDDIMAWYALEDVVLEKASKVLGVNYESMP